MPLLFSYGTLQQREVQLSLFGRTLQGQPDVLPRFERTLVKIEDPATAAELGESHHVNAAFNGRDDSRVTGTAFEVSDAELGAADEYERPAGYERVTARLASGRQAWVYSHGPAAKAAATYNAAADLYDDPANTFWERFGARTVEGLKLEPGARVLDVCCGSGASALRAAEIVGPEGSVFGVDLAESLLALARAKARARGLRNIEFRAGDMLDLGLGSSRFDAVVCVFGIFFVPDMAAAVRELWGAVRPGGRLAVTTWGPRFFEPASTAFWDSIRDVRPELYKSFNPWDRISDAESLRALLREGGVAEAVVRAEPGAHEVPSPEAWWSAVLGSGYRGTIEQLDAVSRERVREANARYIIGSNIRSVEANVVYAVATRSAA